MLGKSLEITQVSEQFRRKEINRREDEVIENNQSNNFLKKNNRAEEHTSELQSRE